LHGYPSHDESNNVVGREGCGDHVDRDHVAWYHVA
jgi:hypothetical protein